MLHSFDYTVGDIQQYFFSSFSVLFMLSYFYLYGSNFLVKYVI